MSKHEHRTIDAAAQKGLDAAAKKNMKTAWDREDEQSPHCGFGKLGLCCRICEMGPCRIDPFGEGPQKGVCGADKDTIVARHLIRQVAGGAAAHSDHGNDIVRTLLLTAQGKTDGYKIKDPEKLKKLALEWGIDIKDKQINAIAEELALKSLAEWGQQYGELKLMTTRPPKGTLENWRKWDLMPEGIEHPIVETMHRTHEGVDADYKNLILYGIKTAMADGWGGSMMATDVGDVIFGSPKPIRSQVNLGVLKDDQVNIVVHGHEPTLSEMVVEASRDKELLEMAAKNGAKGINISGICCTANEILMRQGSPVAGNFLCQELAIATGAVDVMLVDVQCVMPALADHVEQFHTKLITTSRKAKIRGAEHMQFEEEHALTTAKEIVKKAIENYPNRGKTDIPPEKQDLLAGFTVENTFYNLGGKYRGSFRPLNDAIISGRLRGVVGVVGCNMTQKVQDYSHRTLVKELIKNDVLVVQTGCSATACAKEGLLQPEAAKKWAGKGLQEICETVGIPPVLHLGSCVDNSRILVALCEMIREGGLGEVLSDLPVAGSAPEAMCEKAIEIGFYVVGSGGFVHFSPAMRVLGSENVTKLLTEEMEEITGGKFCFENDPFEAAHRIIDHIDRKRTALKLKPMMYEQSYKPKA